MNRILLLILVLFTCNLSFGQKSKAVSWKTHKKKAIELFELRQYSKAGAALEKAYALKPQRGDLLVSAGGYYMQERDFANAARVFGLIIDNPKYKSSKINYAYSLKQSNQFEKAMIVFASCLDMIEGKNDKKEAQINKEIMGCQFALEQIEESEVKPYEMNIAQLNSGINSRKAEFAPFYVSDTKFYFSSLVKGYASIRSSEWIDGKWSEGAPVKGLKGFKRKHLCNAMITPYETEMFFTVCEDSESWGKLSSRCDIYMSKNRGNAWSNGVKLGANVNHGSSTNTQPYVIEKDGQQHLYFASTRSGGQGGMDLWYSSRSLETKDAEFGPAINLGPNINTKGDEITPFYNASEGVLYFSSDGHLTMGGQDVYKSVGDKINWSTAENLGVPINSGADESYYTIAKNSTEGYFVSNRAFGENKLTSRDEDIFSFDILLSHFFVEGAIIDQENRNTIEDARVYLYELKEATEDRRLLSTIPAEGGRYNFRLLPNRNYQLSFEADGYAPNISYLNTNDENLFLQEKNISLTSKDAQGAVASLDGGLMDSAPADVVETENENTILAPTTIGESKLSARIESQMEKMTEAKENSLVIGAPEKVAAPIVKESLVIGAPEKVTAPIVTESLVIGAVETTEDSAIKEIAKVESAVVETAAVVKVQESLVIGGAPEESVATNLNSLISENKNISESTAMATAAEVFIAGTLAAENSNSTYAYAPTESKNYGNTNNNISTNLGTNNSFVSKGVAEVPSGTGIYTYNEVDDNFRKEVIAPRVSAYEPIAEPVYSNPSRAANVVVVSDSESIPDPVYSNNSGARNTTIVNTSSSSIEKSEAPTSNLLMGTTYKVQLITVEYHNPENRRYDGIRNIGLDLNTEYIEGKGWVRVLLGSFKTESEAKSVLDNARSNGFKRAYVVQYQDGQRKKRIK